MTLEKDQRSITFYLLDGLAKLLQLSVRREDECLALEERLPARVHLARHLARVEALLLESRHVVVAICGRIGR